MARLAYIGIGGKARKIKKIYLTPAIVKNLIPDGIFTKAAWSGGAQSTTHVKYGKYARKMTGTTSVAEALCTSSATIPLNPAHIYYARIEVYQESIVGSVDIYFPVAEPSFLSGASISQANTWQIVSGVSGRSSFASGRYQIRFDFNNQNRAGAMWFDGAMLIDLTDIFGSGNEPTKDWCDKNIRLSDDGELCVIESQPSIIGLARRVSKGYIGIGGVARPFWSDDILEYYGRIDDLGAPTSYNAAASAESKAFALFGGGWNGNECLSTVTLYSPSLVKSLVSSMNEAKRLLSAANAGDTVIFAGGSGNDGRTRNSADAYQQGGTKVSVGYLSYYRDTFCGVPFEDNAIFAGGYSDGSIPYVEYYNKSLTRRTAGSLSVSRHYLCGAVVGGHVLIGGGEVSSDVNSAVVDVYDDNLTRSTASQLNEARQNLAAAHVGDKDYAIFSGGKNDAGTYVNTVDAYNKSLTKVSVLPLSYSRYLHAACSIGGFALFSGGYGGGNYRDQTEVYDGSLTKSIQTGMLSQKRYRFSATPVGNYVLFGGGSSRYSSVTTYHANVDAYVHFPPYAADEGSGDMEPVIP